MILTRENYHSKEANQKYMSASQFKDFMECESYAMAKINGDWVEEPSVPMLVGSYVDAHFSNEMDLFKAKNPEIFKKDGNLKSQFLQANDIIARIERDDMMMRYLSGQTQVIKIGEISGIPFKTRIDSYHPGIAIVDLKIMRDMFPVWKGGERLSFVEAWGYDIQGAIYRESEGNNLPFILAVATKENTCNIALLSVPEERLAYCIEEVRSLAPRYHEIKQGVTEASRCGQCDWCRHTKVLTEVIDYSEVM